MYKTEKLKALVNERLKAAAEEIFSLFEKTIQDYQEEVFRSKQEIDNQRRLAGCKAPLQLSVQEEEVPPEQEHCENKIDLCEVDQELAHIKEEHEELWTNQSGEKLQEDDTKDSLFNIIYMHRSDEDARLCSHPNQIIETVEGDPLPSSSPGQKAHSDPEYCGAAEPTGDYQTSKDIDSNDVCRDDGGHQSGTDTSKQKESGETDRPYNCSLCNKNFRLRYLLTRHLKKHTGVKPYSCSVCSKRFIERSDLQTHMLCHSGQKPYTCSFCGRGFTQIGNMNVHIRIHTGEKPHSCSYCGKCFREKTHLMQHTVIHTGEKPYSCSICLRKFSTQSNLTRHMMTHSGERPFNCTVCDKSFIRESQLIVHMRTHARELESCK